MHQRQQEQADDIPFPTGVLWRDLAALRARAIDEGWSHDRLLAESDSIIAEHEGDSRR